MSLSCPTISEFEDVRGFFVLHETGEIEQKLRLPGIMDKQPAGEVEATGKDIRCIDIQLRRFRPAVSTSVGLLDV